MPSSPDSDELDSFSLDSDSPDSDELDSDSPDSFSLDSDLSAVSSTGVVSSVEVA